MIFREKQQLIICVAAITLMGGFLLFGYIPIKMSKGAISKIKTKLDVSAIRATNIGISAPDITEKYEILKQKVGNFDSRVPGQIDLGLFLEKLAKVMEDNNLKEHSIQPGKEETTEKISCVPISMKCKGTFEQIFEFFKDFQSLEREIRIEDVKLTNDKDLTGELTMQAEAVIYYRPQVNKDKKT